MKYEVETRTKNTGNALYEKRRFRVSESTFGQIERLCELYGEEI